MGGEVRELSPLHRLEGLFGARMKAALSHDQRPWASSLLKCSLGIPLILPPAKLREELAGSMKLARLGAGVF